MLPPSVNYTEEPSMAFVHKYVPDILFPTGTFSNNQDAIIKFNMKRDGLIDPYSMYFKTSVTVPNDYLVSQKSPCINDFCFASSAQQRIQPSVSDAAAMTTNLGGGNKIIQPMYFPYGFDANTQPISAMRAVQVDGSSMEMFREVVLSDSMEEVERIKNQDVLCNMLNCIQFFNDNHSTRKQYGMGGVVTPSVAQGAFKQQVIPFSGVKQMIYQVQAGVATSAAPNYATSAGQSPSFIVGGCGDPTIIYQNPLISQYYGGSAKNQDCGFVYSTVNQSPRILNHISNYGGLNAGFNPTFGGFQLANPVNLLFPASANNGTLTPFNASFTTFYGQITDTEMPHITGITGNFTSGCAFSPATLNLIDIFNQKSPFCIPPLSLDMQLYGSAKPDTNNFGYLPLSKPSNMGNVNTNTSSQQIQEIEYDPCYDPAISQFGVTNNFVEFKTKISDFTDGIRNYSEFINGMPTQMSAYFANTSFEPVWSYDIVQNGYFGGQSTYEILTANIQPNAGNTLLQNLTNNGAGQKQMVITTHTFITPFPSAFLGRYLPPDKYKLIPFKGFKDFMIEVRINPHWLFTSFWSPTNDARKFVINNMELHFEMVEFYDANIEMAINNSLTNGLTLYTHAWYNCLEYQIDGSNIPNNVQINVGFDSLKLLLFCFLDNAYQKNSCYRKHFRLSQNINEMRLKIGADWFPSLPYRGDSGTTEGLNNVNEFYYKLLQAFGIQHDADKHLAINPLNFTIGQRRFYYDNAYLNYFNQVWPTIAARKNQGCISPSHPLDMIVLGSQDYTPVAQTFNSLITTTTAGGTTIQSASLSGNGPLPWRIIDTCNGQGTVQYFKNANTLNNVQPYYYTNTNAALLTPFQPSASSAAALQKPTMEWLFSIVAFCGNLQYCYHLENTYIGKAMYAIDLDSLNYDGSMFSGVSTNGKRPFDLVLKNNQYITSAFNGSSTLYGFGYYDMTLKLQYGVPAQVSGHA